MDLSKLVNDNGVYLYQDDNFNTINILLTFLSENGPKQEAINYLLCQYLLKSNKKYSKEKNEINRKIRELYSLEIYFSPQKIGDTNNIIMYLDMIAPEVVGEEYSGAVFEFLKNILLYPDFTDEEELENIKRTYLSSKANDLSNINKKSTKLFYQNTFLSEDDEYFTSTDLDYFSNIINSITLKNLEDAYNHIINESSFYRGLVFGKISLDEFKSFRKHIPYKTNKESINYSKKCEIIEGDKEISDKDTNESIIYVTYKINHLSNDMISLLNGIFNATNGLCYQILREKYGLVYSAGVNILCYRDAITFKAKIDKNNKQKTLDAIEEIISIVTDKVKLKPFLDYVKQYHKNDFNMISEKKSEMFDEIDDYIRGIGTGYDKYIERIDSYTEDDVIEYTRSLKRMNVFMYKGDKDE